MSLADPLNTFSDPIDRWLNKTATVIRIARVSVGGGKWADQPVAAGTLPVRRVPAGRAERLLAAQHNVKCTDAGYCHDVDVKRGDQWVIDGVTYEVTFTVHPSQDGDHTKVLLDSLMLARPATVPPDPDPEP